MRRTLLAISTALRDWGRSLETAAPSCTSLAHQPSPDPQFSSLDDREPGATSPPADPTRTATDLVWPMTRRQEKSRVSRAFSNVLTQDPTLRDELLSGVGFAVKAVRVSPDHAKAFVLWDSYTGQAAEAERVLARATPRLRAALARALATRAVPRLEFRHDGTAEETAELDSIFEKIEMERKGGRE